MSRALSLVSLCATILVIAGLVAGCAPFPMPPMPTPDLNYDTNPGTLVIEADAHVQPGPRSLGEECNYIPYLRVWGDGQVIRVDYQNRQRQVWSGHISPSRIQQMLTMLRSDGFFTPWTPVPLNPAGTWARIKVNLSGGKTQSYSVETNRSNLDRLFGQVDVNELEPYVPEKALLVTCYRGPCSTDEAPEWPARFGFSLADAQGSGRQITGEVLTFTWQEVNTRYWQKIQEVLSALPPAFCENGQAWGVCVQIPGVSAKEPPYKCWYATPMPIPTPPSRSGTPFVPELPTPHLPSVTPNTSTPYPPSSTGGRTVNPHIDISASATALRVGDTVTITGVPVDIGLPYYTLYLNDQAIERVTYGGEARPESGTNPVLEFVSAEGTMKQAKFVLRAKAAGVVQARINATGEVHYPQGAMWAGGGSDPIQITVHDT